MSEFDPDAYLKARANGSTAFDPDAYLKVKTQAAPSQSRAAVLGYASGGTFGMADEIGGLWAKLSMGKPMELGPAAQPSADDTPEVRALKERVLTEQAARPTVYQTMRGHMLDEQAKAQAEHPWTYRAGEVAGGLSTIPLVPGAAGVRGAAAAAKAAPVTLRAAMASGAKTGLGMGVATGFGNSNSDLTTGDPSQYARALLDTGMGGLFGLGLGAAAPAVIKAGGWALGKSSGLVRSLKDAVTKGVVKPTEAAQVLREAGVKNLTIGQMNPNTALAQAEEVGASTGVLGPRIRAQREAAQGEWQDAVLREATAPEGSIPGAGSANEKLASAYEGFKEAYGSLKGHRVEPELYVGKGKWQGLTTDESLKGAAKTTGLFELATKNRNIRATDETRRGVLDFLREQLTMLPKGASKNGMPAEALQELRSTIRQEIRKTLRGNPGHEERAAAEMLERAEQGVTELLENQLPPDVVSKLRATDAKYGTHKTVSDAVGRAGDQPAGFTPSHLSAAVKAAEDKGAYARGAGGRLRELSSTGKEVLEAKIPETGVKALMSWGPMPSWAVGPAAYVANMAGPKAFLLGETAFQKNAQALENVVMQNAVAKALRATGRGVSAVAGNSAAATRALLPSDQRLQLELASELRQNDKSGARASR